LRVAFVDDLAPNNENPEKFIDMFINTWIIHASVNFTNNILDSGVTPSVITAIMKQQTTERARTILNNGMDIYILEVEYFLVKTIFLLNSITHHQ
jgi:CTP:phosphocholine cytidylyltransferase-like protein